MEKGLINNNLGSNCDCFPWCEHLKDDGMEEEDNDLQRVRSENVLG